MKNNFCRNLNLPVKLDISFSSWIESDKINIFRLRRDFLGEEFEDFLSSMGLCIYTINGFYIPPKSYNNFIFRVGAKERYHSRIIIKYGAKSSLKFWELNESGNEKKNSIKFCEFDDEISEENSNEELFFTSNEESLKLIYEHDQSKISLINGGYYQSIYNESEYSGYQILVDLYFKDKNRLSWGQSLKKFKNYII